MPDRLQQWVLAHPFRWAAIAYAGIFAAWLVMLLAAGRDDPVRTAALIAIGPAIGAAVGPRLMRALGSG